MLSLKTGALPRDWLRARIIPIHKSGNRFLVDTYRPISLTTYCCELMEHILNKAIINYLESNNMLYPKQHGFRRGLSTVTQLAEITHDFAGIIDSKLQADAIFIDFAKAFDRVPHSKLISKLESFGINSKVIAWISAYLTNRSQYATLNNIDSDCLSVLSGVPQGSVLGPTLFLIYVNDISSCAEPGVTLRLFADDCVIYSTIRSIDDQLKLNSSLRNISQWCEMWGMEINVSKTAFISLTKKKRPLSFVYSLNGFNISKVDKVKYLGVTFSQDLKWEQHITNTCAKAYKQLGFLRRKLGKAPSAVKLTAYKTLVRPILEYGSIVWDPHQNYLRDKLERLQNRALRFIYSKYSWRDSATDMRNQAHIATLSCRRHVASMKFFYLLFHGHLKICKDDYIHLPGRRSSRTNHDKCIRPFSAHSNVLKYSFFPRAVNAWNALPSEAVNITNIDQFCSFVEQVTEPE